MKALFWFAIVVVVAGTVCQAKQQAAPALDRADRVQAGDRLHIHATNTLPDLPIRGVFRVEPSGKVALGPGYGRVQVKGLTLEEAEDVLRDHLGQVIKDPKVSITRFDPLPGAGDQADALALEKRVRQLEAEVRALREAVEGRKK